MITGTTDSGLRYALRRSTSEVAYCSLSIRCGTRDEGSYHGGIAHFVEHTLFKGTSRKSSSVINSYLDRLGGELNAYTTKEEIVIHATVLKEDLNKAISLLLELVSCPVFPEHEISTEKSVVIDEINSYKDSPSDEVYDRFEEMLFDGHPLGTPILGTAASVRRMDSPELNRFVKEKFLPCDMALAVVADVEESRVEKKITALVKDYFPVDSPAAPAVDRRVLTSPRRNVTFDRTVNKHNHEVNCVTGGFAPSLYDGKDRVVTALLCNILGGPASNSILNDALREKTGWVYGVECSYTQYADTGIVAICFGCDKENLDKCNAVIRKKTDRLRTDVLSDARLKAAKKQYLGQLAISGDNGETQCLSMGKSLLAFGKVLTDEQTRAMIESVTPQEIKDMACRLFDESNISRLVYL